MAITHTESNVLWSTAYSVSVSAGGYQTSDVLALDATCVNADNDFKLIIAPRRRLTTSFTSTYCSRLAIQTTTP